MDPSSPELPPAVMVFLLGGCELSVEVFAAVLRGLASEDVVRYGMDASGTQVIGPGAPSPRSGRSLLPFEQTALEWLRRRARGRTGVPLWVLLSADSDGYDRWQRTQTDQLGREAKRAGMAVLSARKGVWQTALALAVLAACAAVVVPQVAPNAGLDATAAAIVVGFLAVLMPLSSRRWRLTPAGAAAVVGWRRSGGSHSPAAVGRHRAGPAPVAPSTALVPTRSAGAPLTVTGPAGAPLPKGHAWSSLGGSWHPVRVGRELKRAYWGSRASLSFLVILLIVGTLFVVGYGHVKHKVTAGAFIPVVLAEIVLLVAWLTAFARRMRMPDTTTFTGEVVKCWRVQRDDSPDSLLVCVDDGVSSTGLTFDIGPDRYARLKPGNTVRVTWSPRWRRLNDIEAVTDPQRPSL